MSLFGDIAKEGCLEKIINKIDKIFYEIEFLENNPKILEEEITKQYREKFLKLRNELNIEKEGASRGY